MSGVRYGELNINVVDEHDVVGREDDGRDYEGRIGREDIPSTR
jgi:hypothetical protein